MSKPEIDEKINQKNDQGETPLIIATKRGDAKAVQDLAERGADLNQTDKNGDTALIIAARNDQLKIAQILVVYDADLNSQNNDGDSALHIAALKNNISILLLLLEHKCHVDNINKINGKTPLIIATEVGEKNLYAIDILLKFGADINLKDKSKTTALEIGLEKDIQPIKTISDYVQKLDQTCKLKSFVKNPTNSERATLKQNINKFKKEITKNDKNYIPAILSASNLFKNSLKNGNFKILEILNECEILTYLPKEIIDQLHQKPDSSKPKNKRIKDCELKTLEIVAGFSSTTDQLYSPPIKKDQQFQDRELKLQKDTGKYFLEISNILEDEQIPKAVGSIITEYLGKPSTTTKPKSAKTVKDDQKNNQH